METNLSPVSGDTASLEAQLNSAVWVVGILIVPSTEPCEDRTDSDESEVR
jgi:hypothetical protein